MSDWVCLAIHIVILKDVSLVKEETDLGHIQLQCERSLVTHGLERWKCTATETWDSIVCVHVEGFRCNLHEKHPKS